MREIGRQRRLRRLAFIGLAAMVAIGVGGALRPPRPGGKHQAAAAPGPEHQQAVLRLRVR